MKLEARPGQALSSHLQGVADRAEKFGEKFHSAHYCRVAALMHDYGKASPEWQRYLYEPQGKMSHAPESAGLTLQLFGKLGLPLAYAIKGHHSHLPDWHGDLDRFMTLPQDALIAALNPDSLLGDGETLRQGLMREINRVGAVTTEYLPLWIRMIASALIDADRLDAEAFDSPDAGALRGRYEAWEALEAKFRTAMDARNRDGSGEVNRIRRAIAREVSGKAEAKRGFFALNVPTGGGKTLCSMDFALRHRQANSMDRIIMAIPYNSIIEQTAAVYKGIFGEENVLEHHSNFDPGDDRRYRQAVENWDAPVVVTTNVQLFESLLKSGASELRKLHNIANSIIILDEAQMLPREHLVPILATLRGLVAEFGCSVVLCSATVPALEGEILRSDSSTLKGLPAALPLIADPDALAGQLRRTRIRHLGKRSVEELAAELDAAGQALCIVNTKRTCRRIFELVNAPKKYHLSAAMCPAERRELLEEIRKALAADENIVIVATPLIEAGVDIDVRTVYREMAGVDSIAQAAGRCNREGRRDCGDVFTFDALSLPPSLNTACEAAKKLLPSDGEWAMTPTLYHDYFRHYYAASPRFDQADFKTKFGNPLRYSFNSFSEAFHMIDNAYQAPLVVLYGHGADRIEELRAAGDRPTRALYRRLQPYTVNVPKTLLDQWRASSIVETVGGVDVQCAPNLYKRGLGVILSDSDQDCIF